MPFAAFADDAKIESATDLKDANGTVISRTYKGTTTAGGTAENFIQVDFVDSTGKLTSSETNFYRSNGTLDQTQNQSYDSTGKIITGSNSVTYDTAGKNKVNNKQTQYDTTGNKTSESRGFYDASGTLTQTDTRGPTGNLVQSDRYDAAGNVTQTTTYDAAGKVVSARFSSYDTAGKVTKIVYESYTNGVAANQTTTTYDANENIISTNKQAVVSSSGSSGGNSTYQMLAPLIGPNGENVEKVDTTSLPAYLDTMYRIGIGMCFALGVIMFTWAGIEYIVSESMNTKSDAKKRITAALTGLAIALVSYILLYTINPDLLELTNINTTTTP